MTFIEEITSFLGKSLKTAAQELERNARRNVEARMHAFQRFVFKQVFIGIFFAIASLCISLALIFAGIEYLHLTKTISFLAVGVIALLIAVLIKTLN